MSIPTKKTYIVKDGKHHTPEKVYRKGDKIELTEEEAKGLANKLIDPEAEFSFAIDTPNTSAVEEENARLKEQLAQAQKDNETMANQLAKGK